MASRLHPDTVRTVHCTPPLPSCNLCKKNVVNPGSMALPDGRVLSVTVRPPILKTFVYLSCNLESVFHEKCIEHWFLINNTCPIHHCEATLVPRFIEQVPPQSKSSDDPTAQTVLRSKLAAEERLSRSDLYNSSESSDELYS